MILSAEVSSGMRINTGENVRSDLWNHSNGMPCILGIGDPTLQLGTLDQSKIYWSASSRLGDLNFFSMILEISIKCNRSIKKTSISFGLIDVEVSYYNFVIESQIIEV